MYVEIGEIIVMVCQFIDWVQEYHNDLVIAILGGVIVAIAVYIIGLLNQHERGRKARKSISSLITKMFQEIEKSKGVINGQARTSGTQREYLSTYIVQLINWVAINATNLKPGQVVELSELLNKIYILENEMLPRDKAPTNKYFESLLKDFKEIKWLKIDIKKLNWREDNREN